MIASDYVGIVSGRNTPDKMEKTGWTIEKAPNVNAPVFKEFPMTLECRVKQKIDESETMCGLASSARTVAVEIIVQTR